MLLYFIHVVSVYITNKLKKIIIKVESMATESCLIHVLERFIKKKRTKCTEQNPCLYETTIIDTRLLKTDRKCKASESKKRLP